ncbi:MAG: hypothetical protein Q9222_006497, partial [Ikaeria aurantiellina]
MHGLTCRTASRVALSTLVLSVRRITRHQHTKHHRSLHSSRRLLQTDHPPDLPSEARNHLVELSTQSLESISDAASEASSLGGSGNEPEKPAKPVDKSNYGSASRRAGRNMKRLKEIPPVQLPERFLESNVFLRERLKEASEVHQGEINTGVTSSSKSQEYDVEKFVPGEAAQKNASQSGGEDDALARIRRDRFSGPFWKEIYSMVTTGLRLPISAHAESTISARPHLVLHGPDKYGEDFFNAFLKNIASRNSADLIKIDAQDIAEIGGDYLDVPGESQDEALSTLGYDIHANQTRESQRPGQQSEEEYDEDKDEEEGETRPPRSMKLVPGAITAIPINTRLMKPIRDLLKNTVPALSNLQATPRSNQMFQVMGAPVKESTREMKITTFVDTMLQAADIKRTMRPAAEESPSADNAGENSHEKGDVNAAATSMHTGLDHDVVTSLTTIVWVEDYPEIYNTSNGGKIMEVLHEILQERRNAGQRILLVGTCSSKDHRLAYPRAGSKSTLWEFDTGPTRTIIIPTGGLPASMAGFAQSRRTQAINIRHLQDMIRRLTSDPKHTDGIVFQKKLLKINSIQSSLPEIRDQVWTPDIVHRVASVALGMMADGENMTIKHIDEALMTIDRMDRFTSDWVAEEKQKEKKSWSDGSDDRRHPGRRKPNREETWAKLRNKCNSHEKKLLHGVVDPSSIRTTFTDVRAPKETIEALKTLTSLSLERPDAFTYGVLATDKIPGLLLYGPPGTGKTLLAKAVAKECGATVLEISGSDINDKYVGEGEKNVRAIFSLARKLTPCIVFIDEADAILGSRGNRHERVSHRELLNQFLKEWDGMNEMSTFIMVATNRPFDLDEATLRRLPRRMLVDLPTEEDREAILKIHLKDENLHRDVSLAKLAAETPLYSGSDLKNLAVAAALACVREEYDAAKAASAVAVPTSEITSSG